MHSYTSGSEKKFFAIFFFLVALLLMLAYAFLEDKAEDLDRKAKHDLYSYLVNYPWDVDFVTLGSSHGDNYVIHGSGIANINLAKAWTIPPVMYFKAKALLRYHPEVKVVYLEADEHHFFNGSIFDLSGLTPDEKRDHPIFQWARVFFDEEESLVFGEVSPEQKNPWLVFDESIKPVIVRRLMEGYFYRPDRKDLKKAVEANACDPAIYPDEPEIVSESTWSSRSPEDKATRIRDRGDAEFSLGQARPLSPFMTEYYEKTITLLQRAGVEVVLILYPRVPEYEAAMHPEIRRIHAEYLQKISKEYGLDILDTRDIAKYGEKIFEDQDHLAGPYWWLMGKRLVQDYCARTMAQPLLLDQH